MIHELGSLSLVWILLWFLLTLLVSLVYPLVRPLISRLHPAHGSALLLLYWSAPALLALAAGLMLYAPLAESLLITPHCHGSCVEHSPQTSELSVALMGLVLAMLAAAGMSVNLIYNAVRGGRMRRQLEMLGTVQKRFCLLNSAQPVVFTLGWWHPGVFISRGLLEQCSPEQLSVILRHEQAHSRRRDNMRLLALRVFTCLLPARIRKQVVYDLQILCEQACDFAAAEKHGAILVAETLIHISRLVKHAAVPRGSLAFDGGDLEIRVHALLGSEERRSLRSWQLFMSAAVIAAILLVLLDPLHHGAEWLISRLDSLNIHTH